jgi:hypothetical protein
MHRLLAHLRILVQAKLGVHAGSAPERRATSDERGRDVARLTQGQGSNLAPVCSPDGRLLAFFSTRKSGSGLYLLNVKRFTTIRVTSEVGESLNWARLSDNSVAQALEVRSKSKIAKPSLAPPAQPQAQPPQLQPQKAVTVPPKQ